MNACRIVLVRPEIAGNIGATARIMRNLGASDLVLVAPVADPRSEQATQMATAHASDVLSLARIVPDLPSAIADCVLVAGTSARTGGLYRRQTVAPPAQIAPILVETMKAGPVALVFGPEPHGLSNEEVTICHHLIHIPSDETYPALNLGQAVAICLYEVRRAWLAREVKSEVMEIASHAEQSRMFADLGKSLQEIRYLRGSRGEALMHAIRHLLGRAQLSPMEVNLLIGLARQLRWVAKHAEFED
jgi:tRNA/rRNA methyltransferase